MKFFKKSFWAVKLNIFTFKVINIELNTRGNFEFLYALIYLIIFHFDKSFINIKLNIIFKLLRACSSVG